MAARPFRVVFKDHTGQRVGRCLVWAANNAEAQMYAMFSYALPGWRVARVRAI